jgi:basic membrane protein A
MIKKLKILLLSTVVSVGAWGCAKNDKINTKETYKISLILSTGGVNDQSFNQSAWEGALKAQEELGVEVSYLESNSDSDYMQNIETAVEDSDLIVGVGFQVGDSIKEASKLYTDKQFVTIDSENENLDNVRAITFSEEEAGYLTGLIAGKTTKTNVIGWIGGLDIPSCSNFYVGYEKGAKEANPNIKVLKQFTNSFSDASKGKVVAQQMINENADIIFTASGGGNIGSIEAIKENNIYGIGVDMPMNYLAPQNILTSALKNVGEGLRLTIKDYAEGNFTGGEVKYNSSNGGVGFEKTDLLSDDVVKYVEDKLKSN